MQHSYVQIVPWQEACTQRPNHLSCCVCSSQEGCSACQSLLQQMLTLQKTYSCMQCAAEQAPKMGCTLISGLVSHVEAASSCGSGSFPACMGTSICCLAPVSSSGCTSPTCTFCRQGLSGRKRQSSAGMSSEDVTVNLQTRCCENAAQSLCKLSCER